MRMVYVRNKSGCCLMTVSLSTLYIFLWCLPTRGHCLPWQAGRVWLHWPWAEHWVELLPLRMKPLTHSDQQVEL